MLLSNKWLIGLCLCQTNLAASSCHMYSAPTSFKSATTEVCWNNAVVTNQFNSPSTLPRSTQWNTQILTSNPMPTKATKTKVPNAAVGPRRQRFVQRAKSWIGETYWNLWLWNERLSQRTCQTMWRVRNSRNESGRSASSWACSPIMWGPSRPSSGSRPREGQVSHGAKFTSSYLIRASSFLVFSNRKTNLLKPKCPAKPFSELRK